MKRTFSLLLALTLLLVLLCGCGNNSTADTMTASGYVTAANASKAETEEIYWEAAKDYGWEVPAAAEAQNEAVGSSNLPANVKLIYTANIDLESTEFDAAATGLDKLVADLGGYYENNQLNNYSRYRCAYYTVRVPAENFETFCAAVGELCQVNNISRAAEDISERYYDTESRLVTQQTKLERLQELLEQAEDMDDIITLESAISETELTIENLTGTLRKYDSLVVYSTIDISLTEVYKLTEIEEPVIGFGAKLAAAFKTGCSSFVDGLQDLLIGFARGWVGWLIFFAAVAVVIILIVRRSRRKKQEREEARAIYEARRAEKKNKE